MSSSNGHNTWDSSAATSREVRKPRICMPSGRTFKRKAFHCGHYEAQDVLCEVDDVDLICLEPERGYEFKESWQRRLLYRDVTRKLIFQNPGLKKVRLKQEYDLFFAICQTHHDFLNINAIEGWKDHCKTSVVWFDEMWAALIPRYKYWLHALKKFDHIFVGARGTVGPLADAIGKPVHWLSGGVDTVRFSPRPNPPTRAVDVYSIGRRAEGIHQILLKEVDRKNLFYIYDTFEGSLTNVRDHKEHRNLFANVAKRSKYFMVAPGKIDSSSETKGQLEVGFRYYEGAAAGAILLGQAPDCDAFREMFPWRDAVIEVHPDGSNVLEVLSRLKSEPERAAAIGGQNAEGALLHHDWVYRFKEIFRVAGIEPSASMVARERRLKELAAQVSGSMQSEAVSRQTP